MDPSPEARSILSTNAESLSSSVTAELAAINAKIIRYFVVAVALQTMIWVYVVLLPNSSNMRYSKAKAMIAGVRGTGGPDCRLQVILARTDGRWESIMPDAARNTDLPIMVINLYVYTRAVAYWMPTRSVESIVASIDRGGPISPDVTAALIASLGEEASDSSCANRAQELLARGPIARLELSGYALNAAAGMSVIGSIPNTFLLCAWIVRRRKWLLRYSKSLCLHCGYPLAVNCVTCPECGARY